MLFQFSESQTWAPTLSPLSVSFFWERGVLPGLITNSDWDDYMRPVQVLGRLEGVLGFTFLFLLLKSIILIFISYKG